MTESSSGLDAIESRFQRRERSIRPPRRPRKESRNGKNESHADDETLERETRPSLDVSSGEATADLAQEAGASATDDVASASLEAAPPAGQSDDKQTAGEPQASETLSVILRQRVSDALAPVMGNLQQQIADAVREQMHQAQDGQRTSTDVAARVDETSTPASPQAPDSVTTEAKPASSDVKAPQPSLLQAAMRRTAGALRQMLKWMARAVRALLRKMAGMFRTLGPVLWSIALKVGDALGVGFRAVGRAGGSAARGFLNALRTLLARLVERLVVSPLR